MPILEAILDTELQVRVLRQDELAARRLPEAIRELLRVGDDDRVIVRRSCLLDSDLVTASVNYVVTVPEPAVGTGVEDVRVPIGYSLLSHGVRQSRHVVRVGHTRWPDGRLCAAKAYVIVRGEQPLCYIRESFNPGLIAPDHSRATDADRWDDEPEGEAGSSEEYAAAGVRTPSHDGSTMPAPSSRPGAAPDSRGPSSLRTELADATHGDAFVLHLGQRTDHGGAPALLYAASAVVTHALGRATVPVLTHRAAETADPALSSENRFAREIAAGDRARHDDPVTTRRQHSPATPSHAIIETHDTPELFVDRGIVDAGSRGGPHTESTGAHRAPTLIATSAELLRRTAQLPGLPVPPDLLREVAGLMPLAATLAPTARELHTSIPALWWSRTVPSATHRATIPPPDARADQLWFDYAPLTPQHLRRATSTDRPVGVLLDPATTAAEVETLCRAFGADTPPGKLTLVARVAATDAERLPELFAAAGSTPVCWLYDPLPPEFRAAADTATAEFDTGDLAAIGTATTAFFRACRATDTVVGGLRLSDALTPGQVLRCVLLALTEARTP
ncbi:3-deoxy-7-phosphoheptulonate synthase [Nocardia callitridis]|uniref:Phospho-2-dehydro-3-deoxyheptonate aldolase n=1 Tax=Nocardia callitridis TaxID=648753 RepID=A0ABP9KMH9_9NOCA